MTTATLDPVTFLSTLQPDERAEFIADLSPAEVAYLETLYASAFRIQRTTWEPLPHQKPPDSDWAVWLLWGGRGAGKTAAGAQWLNEQAETLPGSRWFVGAPTLGDARSICVEGESGLLAVNPQIRFNRSNLELTWPNGSYAKCMGAYTPEDRERWRGPQWHGGWADEFGSWRQLDEIPVDDRPDVWDHIEFSTRLGRDPRICVTMTPRRRRRVRELADRPDVVLTHGSLHDNPHTSRKFRERILERHGGTRLAKQEIDGLLLDDVVGALWTDAVISRDRITAATMPQLARISVGVDPPGSTSGVCGIVAVGISHETWPHPMTGRLVPHGYIIADDSKSGQPEAWGAQAVQTYRTTEADEIVAEVNYGGDMVASTIRAVDPTVPVRMVRATRGKKVRAEPISVLSVHRRLHVVGKFVELEDEMTSFTEDAPWSPNRLDAMVWAATHLFVPMSGGGQAEVHTHRDVRMPSGGLTG